MRIRTWELLFGIGLAFLFGMFMVNLCTAAEPRYGGVLTIATSPDASALGDAPGLKTSDVMLVYGCLETFIRYDKKGDLLPGLATSWTIDPKTNAIVLNLRKNVKFHDGTDFNAEAAKWNIDYYRLSVRPELKNIESVEVIDDSSIRLKLSKMDNLILSNLGSRPGLVISPTAYKKNGQDWCSKHPVGTGPFEFVSWEKDVSIRLKKFKNYWEKGKPYLDEIRWLIIAEPMTQIASFQAGEVDMVMRIAAKDTSELKRQGKYKITTIGGGIDGIAGDSAHPTSVYADIRVRRAIEYAIDRKKICEKVGYGFWQPINQLARPDGWAHNPDVVGYPYDPEKAKHLLREAGYPNGFKTNLFSQNSPRELVDMMSAIQGYLSAVGINAELVLLDAGRHMKLAVGGGWENGLAWLGAALVPDELSIMDRFFSPQSVLHASAHRPQEYQQVLAQATSAPDFQTMKAITQQLQKIQIDKYAAVSWICVNTMNAASHSYVHDDRICDFSPIQWTPADAWKSK